MVIGKADAFALPSTQGSPLIYPILWGNRHGQAIE